MVSLSGESIPESTCLSDGYRCRLPVTHERSDPSERLHRRLLFLAGRVLRVHRQHHVATGVRLQEHVAKIGAAWDYAKHSDAESSAYVPVEGDRVAEPPLGSPIVQMLIVLLWQSYTPSLIYFSAFTQKLLTSFNGSTAAFLDSWALRLSTLLIWHHPMYGHSRVWSQRPQPTGDAPLLVCPRDRANI